MTLETQEPGRKECCERCKAYREATSVQDYLDRLTVLKATEARDG